MGKTWSGEKLGWEQWAGSRKACIVRREMESGEMVGIPLLWTSREGTLRHLCEVIAAIEGDTMQLFACKVVG